MYESFHLKTPPAIPRGFLRYWLSLYALNLHFSFYYLRIKIRV